MKKYMDYSTILELNDITLEECEMLSTKFNIYINDGYITEIRKRDEELCYV